MRAIVNHLAQLQELALIRDEHRQLSDGEHLDRLDDAIDDMTRKLPAQARGMYQRLSKRDRVVVSALNVDSCSVCGIKLPVSQVQSIRQGRTLEACPSCGRIMYESKVPKWTGEVPKRSEPKKGGIARFSFDGLMRPQLEASTRDGAIRELCELMAEQNFTKDADALFNLALEREAILSTSVDCGLAYPHVRGVEGGGLALSLGVSRDGIKWDEHDDALTHFVFFFTIPAAVSAFYVRLIAGITESFTKPELPQSVLAAETPEALWKVLVKATRRTIK